MASPGDTRLTIVLLGHLQVTKDGHDILIAGPVRRKLLATLAHRPGETLSTDLLCEMVWDGAPPPTAASALRVHISNLRRQLGAAELIERVDSGYRLAIPPESVDIYVFDEECRLGRNALRVGDLDAAGTHLHAAAELWQGQPLVDLTSGADAHIERLLAQRSELNLDLAELTLRTQGPRVDISELSALTVERPFDERVWGLLMTAHYWNGRQADALQTYHRAMRVLDEELGIEPTTALRTLHEQILRQDPALAPPPDTALDLPTFATTLVGRGREIEEIVGLLGEHRLLTLTGLGGIGKTRLAVAAAEAANRHGQRTAFVGLAGLDDPDLVPGLVAAGLDEATDQLDELVEVLSDRDVLLVLDNCEQVVDAVAGLVSALLATCPRIRVLATSRVPLNVVGECVWVTPHLDLTGSGERTAEAVLLFLDRAAHASPQASLPPDDHPDVRDAVRLLGGVPLAIELAAAQCSVLTVTDVVRRLRRTADASGGERDRRAGHESMEVALTGTIEHLTPAAQQLLGRLTTFRGPVGVDAIEAVCADEALATSQIPNLLAELAGSSVLVTDLDSERGRYWLLPPVRRLAPVVLERLGHRPVDLSDRHLAYVAAEADQLGGSVHGPQETAALTGLDDLAADLRAGLTHAVLRNPATGLSMAAALAPYWMRRRMHGEGRRWLRQLLAADTGSEPSTRGAALHAAGGLAWDDGDQDAAHELLEQALTIRRGLGDEAALALTLNNVAGLASDRGDHATAIEMWSQAHDLFRKVDHQIGAASTQLNLVGHPSSSGSAPSWSGSARPADP